LFGAGTFSITEGVHAMATHTESSSGGSAASERFAALPGDETLAETVVALKERGFGVEVVDDLDAARRAVLAQIPEGSSVMTNPSVTLEETGISHAIDDGGPYDSARTRAIGLDRTTQLREIKAVMGQPDFALGSVHAITRDGILVIASALGSQLTSYAFGAAEVIFVVGAQKLVRNLAAAHERIHEYCLDLEDARAFEAYGAHSRVGKLLEIHQEDPGRIHVVLIRRPVGF
jgi:acyl-CoA hydrolase